MIRLLQSFFASMSLERKTLLLFGSALGLLMFVAFFVVEFLGRKLVEQGTQSRARVFNTFEVMHLHYDALGVDSAASESVAESLQVRQQTLRGIRDSLLDENDASIIEFEVMGLEDPVPFSNLPAKSPPTDPAGRTRLESMKEAFQAVLADKLARDLPDVASSIDLGENEAFSQMGPGLASPIFAEEGPVNGRYVYYTPIPFKNNCMTCHGPPGVSSVYSETDPVKLAAQYPFRVGKVTMPYSQFHAQTNTIRAIVVSLGMLIVAITLFTLHNIVRYLVLYPMYHLRDVSDAITHGDTNQRATIETEDEFRELADAFNRMLRHLTETQDQIQEVNKELDSRVDQLAQLNLQLYEANRLKSDFLANMSHELRTPLNSIIGFSEVLQGIDSLTDKQRRYASNIQKSGRALLEMINDILDLAKVEAGKMEVKRHEFDLGKLVSAQCDMIHSLSEDKNISLSVQVPENLPRAYQDPNKLGQILNNLLSNAIKFTPEGGMITVSIEDLQDGRFRLQITDTGVGIAEDDQAIIFQKFRQSHKVLDGEGLTREFAGTGLGLSIVRELAKLLGGEVDFESELGRGSSFWAILPWRLRDTSPATTVAAATAETS
jgi:signal transduction histidine kinase